jgi:hypothetical protein
MILLAFAFAFTYPSAHSQAPPGSQGPAPSAQPKPPIRFEVTSIRPHPFAGDEPSNRQMLPGGRFVATATTVRTLLRAEVKSPEQFQQLILSLVEDRFQLKFHREQKEGSIYWLVVHKRGKLGPALKPSAADAKPNMSTNSNGFRTVMNATNMSMRDIASALHRQSVRPVEDHTGLNGTYNFHIEWAPEDTPDSADQSLFTVLKEQLGLKLQPAKGTVELLVIDSISEPSAN